MAHPTLEPGLTTELIVARIAPLGAFLNAGTGNTNDDILLHKNQQTRRLRPGETVEVYLYEDAQGRLTASMKLPRLDAGQAGWLQVRHTTAIGAFLDLGTEKDVLLPYGEMREPRPMKGELVFVALYYDKSGRLAATMDTDGWLHENFTSAKGTVSVGDVIRVRPYLITDRGASVVDTNNHWGIIPAGQTALLKRGSEVEAAVTKVHQDGRLSLSISGDKATKRLSDAETLLEVLVRRGGDMPYSDDSPPEIIMERFGMSKGAFKRALGNLLKEGKVFQEGGWTRLLR